MMLFPLLLMMCSYSYYIDVADGYVMLLLLIESGVRGEFDVAERERYFYCLMSCFHEECCCLLMHYDMILLMYMMCCYVCWSWSTSIHTMWMIMVVAAS